MNEKRSRLIFPAIATATVLAAFLRFSRIGAQSLWDDEVATLRASALTLKQIWTDIPIIDSNPPLIYTLLHYWRKLGESEAAVRSFPALWGIAAIPLCFFTLRRLIGESRAALAALLLAINPLAIYCGQETRYNTMVTFFLLGAVWAFVEVVERPRLRGLFALFAFTALAIYSHYFSFFVIAALVFVLALLTWRSYRLTKRELPALGWLTVLALRTRSAATRWRALVRQSTYVEAVRAHWRGLAYATASLALTALAFVPFLKYFTVQLLRGVHWREPLGVGEVLRRIAVWTFVGHSATAQPTFVSPLANFAQNHAVVYDWLLTAFVLPMIALVAAGLLRRAEGRRNAMLAALVVVPVAGVLVVSRMTPIFDPRYMLPFVPFALGAAAAGWSDLWPTRKWLAAVLGIWMLLLTGFSLKDYYYSPAHWRQDWRGLAERIAAEAEPDATVLFYNFYTSLAFLHYLEKQPNQPPVQYLYVLEERFGPLETKRRRLDALLDGLTAERRHVWLVDYHGYMDDPYDDARQGLSARGYRRVTRECWLPGLWRYCLERWTLAPGDLTASLADEVVFGEHAPSTYQLAEGWYAGEGEMRWIAQEARLRLRCPADKARLAVKFFANLEYLGGPLIVRFSVDGQPIGEAKVEKSELVDWRSEPFAPPAGETEMILTIAPDRSFTPDQVRHDGDKTVKSILIERVALEPADE